MEVKTMIDSVLVKEDMLKYIYHVKTVRGLGRGILSNSDVLPEVELMGTWTKRKEEVNRA